METLKQNLIDYAHALTVYDYAAFAWLLFLFVIILILAILLGRKKPTLAIFLVLVSIFLMFVAPFGVKYFLDETVRKVEVATDTVSQLHYASSLIVTGHLRNDGKISFKKCRVSAKVLKITGNKYKDMLHTLKPLRDQTIVVDKNISRGEQAMFQIVFEQFTYDQEYNVSLSAECY